jgi:predicted PurR-regulated permease PerM
MTIMERKPVQGGGLENVDWIIRVGLVVLLGYWSWLVVAPFLTILLWSGILAVALYPLYERALRLTGHRRFSAVIVTVCSLVLVLVPMMWLGVGLITGAKLVAGELQDGLPSVPAPPEAVKSWPFFGDAIYKFWSRAVTDLEPRLIELAPNLKPFAARLLEFSSSVMAGLLEFLVAIVIAGFLFSPAPRIVQVIDEFMDRALQPRGRHMVRLAAATIHNVSRGVVGVALVQALMAGAGFWAAGVPFPGALAFAAFVAAIVQFGGLVLLPVVLWSWTAFDPTKALIFTAYMLVVGLVDNVAKPVLMARGLSTPMPVILVGVFGGALAYGIIGLFFGPIVLAVVWELLAAWMQGDSSSDGPEPEVSS